MISQTEQRSATLGKREMISVFIKSQIHVLKGVNSPIADLLPGISKEDREMYFTANAEDLKSCKSGSGQADKSTVLSLLTQIEQDLCLAPTKEIGLTS